MVMNKLPPCLHQQGDQRHCPKEDNMVKKQTAKLFAAFSFEGRRYVFSSQEAYASWLEKNSDTRVGRVSVHLLGHKAREMEARIARAKAFGPVGRPRPRVQEVPGAVYSF
ncbi:MAG: hypothetical protein ABIJ23_00715 [Candidatus Magasanikbacteria bacterium]